MSAGDQVRGHSHVSVSQVFLTGPVSNSFRLLHHFRGHKNVSEYSR